MDGSILVGHLRFDYRQLYNYKYNIYQGMWFAKTLFTFRDGYILVGHPSGGSYGQFYYYIMSSTLACKKHMKS